MSLRTGRSVIACTSGSTGRPTSWGVGTSAVPGCSCWWPFTAGGCPGGARAPDNGGSVPEKASRFDLYL